MLIIPAILEQSKEEFWRWAEIVEKMPGVERVQVDFCDGKFVETSSLSIQEIDVLNPTLEWEAHLMVEEPVDFFDYKMAGFSTIIVHLEAFGEKGNPLSQRVTLLVEYALKDIRQLGMKTGLAINPETPIEAVLPYQELVDQFTILSVRPGMQGQEFLPESIGRVKKLRSLLPSAIIEVDGGVNLSNIKDISFAGADACAVGAALWQSQNAEEALEQLKQAAG